MSLHSHAIMSGIPGPAFKCLNIWPGCLIDRPFATSWTSITTFPSIPFCAHITWVQGLTLRWLNHNAKHDVASIVDDRVHHFALTDYPYDYTQYTRCWAHRQKWDFDLKWIKQSDMHDDVIELKYFLRYWSFVQGIHRSPVNSPHKGQWRGASMFSLICAWMHDWPNNREAGDLRRHRVHYDVTVMELEMCR